MIEQLIKLVNDIAEEAGDKNRAHTLKNGVWFYGDTQLDKISQETLTASAGIKLAQQIVKSVA